jgi:hypothetical protein
MYHSLDPSKIIATLEVLSRRICERFPGTGLAKISVSLTEVAGSTSARVDALARPNYAIRLAVWIILLSLAALLGWLVWSARSLETSTELTNVMQGIDAATSLVIVFGGLSFYLWSLEGRWRRDRAMKGLHELRSIIHVIDMHQLTKDPSAFGAPRTSSSPDRSMTPHQLLRYLGYCSELLSLASKVAALYADKLHDPDIVEAVGDIERLTSNLSQKIWQKIELIQERMPTRPASDALGPRADA